MADDPDRFFDQERYHLTKDDGHYRLQSDDGALQIPLDWLEPAEALNEDEESYVESLNWNEKVTSFPIGGGQIGLHFSSYLIADGGSAQAASGRDIILVLQPKNGRLTQGPDLGNSKLRVNVGGCWMVKTGHALLLPWEPRERAAVTAQRRIDQREQANEQGAGTQSASNDYPEETTSGAPALWPGKPGNITDARDQPWLLRAARCKSTVPMLPLSASADVNVCAALRDPCGNSTLI